MVFLSGISNTSYSTQQIIGLLTVPFLENVNKFQNPFRRPVATTVFLIGTAVSLWLGIGATLPIDKSLTLGLF
jgi:hypothetical protein